MKKIIISICIIIFSYSKSYSDLESKIYLHCIIQTETDNIEGFLLLNLSPQRIMEVNLNDEKSILNILKESQSQFKVYDYLTKIPLKYEGIGYEFIYVSYNRFIKIESSSIEDILLLNKISDNSSNIGCSITSVLQVDNQFWIDSEILEEFVIPEFLGSSGRIIIYNYKNNSELKSLVNNIIEVTNRHNSNFKTLNETELKKLRSDRKNLLERIQSTNNTLILTANYD